MSNLSYTACTYVQSVNTSLLSGRFGLLDNLLLGSRWSSLSRLKDIVGQIETIQSVKLFSFKQLE